MTPLAGVPHVPFLGLFPTMETVLAQTVLLALVAYGLVVTVARGRGHAARERDAIRAELRRLQAVAEALQAEVAAGGEGARGLSDRLNGLLIEVAALEKRITPGNGRA
jgi:hypothetical protein